MYKYQEIEARDYLHLLMVLPGSWLQSRCGVYENAEVRYKEPPASIAAVFKQANFDVSSPSLDLYEIHPNKPDTSLSLRSAPQGLLKFASAESEKIAREYPTSLSVHTAPNELYGKEIQPRLREIADVVSEVLNVSMENRLSFVLPTCVLDYKDEIEAVWLVRPDEKKK